jgi:5'-nucleotidase
MPYPIERKLVVGVSSNALFNLEFEDKIFKEEGVDKYRNYQIENSKKVLEPGVAMPFIRRFLNINKVYNEEIPVEVVLLSKNSPETGIRILNAVRTHNLDISRGAFTSGKSPFSYIPTYNISLFLSTDSEDVINAINASYPAGRIIKTNIYDEVDDDMELRIAFDFDGVIADDNSEKVFTKDGLDKFLQHEQEQVGIPHNPGPLADFFTKISFFQRLETKKEQNNNTYKKILRTAIITARSAPSHERAINTLKNWNVTVDEMFLLGGIEKSRVLKVLKPHLFLDDQITHLDPALENIPLVHIPFGIKNQ